MIDGIFSFISYSALFSCLSFVGHGDGALLQFAKVKIEMQHLSYSSTQKYGIEYTGFAQVYYLP